MVNDDACLLSWARPGQVDPGWVAFWQTSDTSQAPAAVTWRDVNTSTAEDWYLNTKLESLAQTTALTVQKVASLYTDYSPSRSLTLYSHTISTPSNPGFMSGLAKYFMIKNAGGSLVAVVAQNQSGNPWIEHWWLDQAWVDLASKTGTTITLTVESESTAQSKYNALGGVTYKKHTFAP